MSLLPTRPRNALLLALAAGGLVLGEAAARSVEELAAALASSGRPASDVVRDAGRRPAEVVAFLGIEPGMTVVDLIAAGGYYTEVLSVAVGPEGKVYAQNTAFVLQMRGGVNDAAMTERLAGGRLANVERLDREFDDLGLEAGSVDAAVTALNFHDILNGRGPEAAARFLAAVHAILAPGGRLAIIDHVGVAGSDNESLHRVPEDRVVSLARAAGFDLAGRGDMLRNASDDHARNVFDESVRGRTDRFVLLFTKPGA